VAVNRSELNLLLATDPLLSGELNSSALGQALTGGSSSQGQSTGAATVLPGEDLLLQSSLAAQVSTLNSILAGFPAAQASTTTQKTARVQLTNSNLAVVTNPSAGSTAASGVFTITTDSVPTAVFSSNTAAATAMANPAAASGVFTVVVANQTNLGTALAGAGTFDLSGAAGYNSTYTGQDLSASDLSGQDLTGEDLSSDMLSSGGSGANLQNATLLNANLAGLDLANVSFSGADLRNANVQGVTNQDFTGATRGIVGTIAVTVGAATNQISVDTAGGLTNADVQNAFINALNGAGLGLTATLMGNQVQVQDNTAGQSFSFAGADNTSAQGIVGGNIVGVLGLNTTTVQPLTVDGANVPVTTPTATIDGGNVTLTLTGAGTTVVSVTAATSFGARLNGSALALGAGNSATVDAGAVSLRVASGTGQATLTVQAAGAPAVTVQDPAVASALAAAGASSGTVDVQVASLATTAQANSGAAVNPSAATAIANGTLAITTAGRTTNVAFANGGATNADLIDAMALAINGADLGLTASITSGGGTNERLTITSGTAGHAGAFSVAGTDAGGSSAVALLDLNTQTTAPVDASVTVNGAAATASGNTLTLENGALTVNLLSTGSTSVTVGGTTQSSTTPSTQSVAKAVASANAFAGSFNSLLSFLNASPLFAGPAQQLQAAVQGATAGLEAAGLIPASNGLLSVDQARLQASATAELSGQPSTLQSALRTLSNAATVAASVAQASISATQAGSQTLPSTALASGPGSQGSGILGRLFGGANVNATA
jgi:flagellar hook-associated protein 2